MKAINIRFPLVDDPEKNVLFKQNNLSKDALVSDLLLLFLTDEGERFYMRDYGTKLRKFIFEPNDNITQDDIKSHLQEKVSKWLPQFTITGVRPYNTGITEDGEEVLDNQLHIHVDFTYRNDVFTEDGSVELIF